MVEVGGAGVTEQLKGSVARRCGIDTVGRGGGEGVIEEMKKALCGVAPSRGACVRRGGGGGGGEEEEGEGKDGEWYRARAYALPGAQMGKGGKGGVLEALPSRKRRGEIQCVVLQESRFTVPEILFHPGDAGVAQGGVSEAVVSCLSVIPRPLRHAFLRNIVVTGGCASLPGFENRLFNDLRVEMDSEDQIEISMRPMCKVLQDLNSGLRDRLNLIDTFVSQDEFRKDYDAAVRKIWSSVK